MPYLSKAQIAAAREMDLPVEMTAYLNVARACFLISSVVNYLQSEGYWC